MPPPVHQAGVFPLAPRVDDVSWRVPAMMRERTSAHSFQEQQTVVDPARNKVSGRNLKHCRSHRLNGQSVRRIGSGTGRTIPGGGPNQAGVAHHNPTVLSALSGRLLSTVRGRGNALSNESGTPESDFADFDIHQIPDPGFNLRFFERTEEDPKCITMT